MASPRLAGLIYGSAMTDLSLDRDKALESLRISRSLAPARITPLPYAIGYAAVHVPGLRRLLKSPPLMAARRRFGRTLGVLD